MSDELAELFAGVDASRELPADLRDDLLATRADLDAVAATEAALRSRPLPSDLRDRLIAAGTASPLPGVTRRRLLRRLGAVGPPLPGALWRHAAAVAVVVLLVAGGLAAAFERRPHDQSVDVVAPPTTTTTSVATATTTTTPQPAPVEAAAPETTTTTARRPRPSPPPPPRERLVAASTCDELLDNYRETALGLVESRVAAWGGVYGASPQPAGTASAASGGAAERPFSGTNVQEAGVDEPDIVKTDGRRVVALDRTPDGNVLRTLVVGDDGVSLASSIPLPVGARGLLLSGERLVVVGSGASGDPAAGSGSFAASDPRAAIWTYDVRDATNPVLVHIRSVEGAYVTARLASGVVRIVVHTYAKGPSFDYPRDGSEPEQRRATEENVRRIRQSVLADWLPKMVSEDRRGPEPVVTEGPVCDCNDAMAPRNFPGFTHLSLITVDPAAPEVSEATSIQGGADTVYASASGLFATTRLWRYDGPVTGPDPRETFIHRFAIESRAPARYEASGSVPGHTLDQFSMSEHAGHFRVATTVFNGDTSESMVTVLRKTGDQLLAVGRVGGLGKGERIYAVRFMGDTGYVVTFRQTDPLYVIDLRDPAAPTVQGELKITGYSAYLHPTDPGRLLGVGQEASEEGVRLGTQVSLYDVSDPAAPRRADQEALAAGSSSAAEFDHHAFLWWAPTRTLAVPVVERDQNLDDGDQSSSSALVLKAGSDTLDVHGRISHAGHVDGWRDGIVTRTFVIGSSLYTLSSAGLLVSDIETLAEQQWVALA